MEEHPIDTQNAASRGTLIPDNISPEDAEQSPESGPKDTAPALLPSPCENQKPTPGSAYEEWLRENNIQTEQEDEPLIEELPEEPIIHQPSQEELAADIAHADFEQMLSDLKATRDCIERVTTAAFKAVSLSNNAARAVRAVLHAATQCVLKDRLPYLYLLDNALKKQIKMHMHDLKTKDSNNNKNKTGDGDNSSAAAAAVIVVIAPSKDNNGHSQEDSSLLSMPSTQQQQQQQAVVGSNPVDASTTQSPPPPRLQAPASVQELSFPRAISAALLPLITALLGDAAMIPKIQKVLLLWQQQGCISESIIQAALHKIEEDIHLKKKETNAEEAKTLEERHVVLMDAQNGNKNPEYLKLAASTPMNAVMTMKCTMADGSVHVIGPKRARPVHQADWRTAQEIGISIDHGSLYSKSMANHSSTPTSNKTMANKSNASGDASPWRAQWGAMPPNPTSKGRPCEVQGAAVRTEPSHQLLSSMSPMDLETTPPDHASASGATKSNAVTGVASITVDETALDEFDQGLLLGAVGSSVAMTQSSSGPAASNGHTSWRRHPLPHHAAMTEAVQYQDQPGAGAPGASPDHHGPPPLPPRAPVRDEYTEWNISYHRPPPPPTAHHHHHHQQQHVHQLPHQQHTVMRTMTMPVPPPPFQPTMGTSMHSTMPTPPPFQPTMGTSMHSTMLTQAVVPAPSLPGTAVGQHGFGMHLPSNPPRPPPPIIQPPAGVMMMPPQQQRQQGAYPGTMMMNTMGVAGGGSLQGMSLVQPPLPPLDGPFAHFQYQQQSNVAPFQSDWYHWDREDRKRQRR